MAKSTQSRYDQSSIQFEELMKAILALFLVFHLMACTHVEKPKEPSKEWVLEPATPDQSLNIDEQFLKKAQDSDDESAEYRKPKKSFLKP